MSDMEAIDKKINEVANDDLDGLEDTLEHIEIVDAGTLSDLQDKAKEMIGTCSKLELKKVLTLLIGIARKSFQEY